MSTGALFMIAPNWKLECLSTDEQLNKMRCRSIQWHTFSNQKSKLLIRAMTWMGLENTLLESSQTQKITYYMSSFICTNVESQWINGCLGLGVGAELTVNELCRVMKCSHTGLWWWLHNSINLLKPLNCILQWVNFKACIFYLNKVAVKTKPKNSSAKPFYAWLNDAWGEMKVVSPSKAQVLLQ